MQHSLKHQFRKSIRMFFVLGMVGALLLLASACSSAAAGSESHDDPWALHTTWVYTATRYAGFNPTNIMTATRRVTETVVERQVEGTTLAINIRRDEGPETITSADTEAFLAVPTTRSFSYWLVLTGTHLYRLGSLLDVEDPASSGDLAVVFPLVVGESWYLNREMAHLYPDKQVDSMLRKVQREDTLNVPAGEFVGCFLLNEVIGGSIFDGWYCPTVGWVERGSDHHGTPYGWRERLLETYVLNRRSL